LGFSFRIEKWRIHLQRRRLQPSLRNQQLIQNTAKWLVKQLLH
jgi:hypothetical protein